MIGLDYFLRDFRIIRQNRLPARRTRSSTMAPRERIIFFMLSSSLMKIFGIAGPHFLFDVMVVLVMVYQ